MRKLGLLASVLLAACVSWDDDTAHCRDIDDDAVRRACLERVLAEQQTPDDNVGPPSCHPASTRPDPDRDRCCCGR